jgi:ABC-type lipoprotein export system ATPase subunit
VEAARLSSLYVEPEQQPDAGPQPALELIDVFKIFRSGPTETVALRGLDLRIEPCETVAVVGPSGSGKSTMLAIAAAMDVPSAGEVRIGGRSLSRLSEVELARLRATEIGVVFQAGNLWPTLSARENVAACARLAGQGSGEAAAAAIETLTAFGLGQRLDNTPDRLSGGEQQRVAIAAVAARHPKVVLCDEPTGELDAENEATVLETLQGMRELYEAAVVLVTHSPRVADACDSVVEIVDGRIDS